MNLPSAGYLVNYRGTLCFTLMTYTVSLGDGSRKMFSAAVMNMTSDRSAADGAHCHHPKVKRAAECIKNSCLPFHPLMCLKFNFFKLQNGSS